MRAERITDAVAYHAEGPVWWPRLGILRWVDMLAGDILALDANGSITRTGTGSPVVAVVRPRARGGVIAAVERGLAVADHDDLRDVRLLDPVITDRVLPGQRFNEGGCDPQGRFYAGTMAYDHAEGAARLLCWDALDADPTTVLDGVTISNGLGWSPDGSIAYYNDSESGRVAVLDHQPESGLTDLRTFVDIPDEAGAPDGLCVDAEGGIWVALFGGGAVHRYTADGNLDAVISVDAGQVTACTFGGPDLATLFITTSREDLPADADPAAGSLFAVEPGVRGLPPLECGF